MYASHQSYTMDAMLGAQECDLLVALVRQRERRGLYGAKITGGGSGGTVAVLADISPSADAALEEIAAEYERKTTRRAEILRGSSDGAGTRRPYFCSRMLEVFFVSAAFFCCIFRR